MWFPYLWRKQSFAQISTDAGVSGYAKSRSSCKLVSSRRPNLPLYLCLKFFVWIVAFKLFVKTILCINAVWIQHLMLFAAINFFCELACDDHALKLKSANQRYMIETIFLSMYLGKYKNAVHSLFFIEWMWYFINFSFWLDGILGHGSWKMDF